MTPPPKSKEGTMKNILPILLVAIFLGCATPFSQFYYDQTGERHRGHPLKAPLSSKHRNPVRKRTP